MGSERSGNRHGGAWGGLVDGPEAPERDSLEIRERPPIEALDLVQGGLVGHPVRLPLWCLDAKRPESGGTVDRNQTRHGGLPISSYILTYTKTGIRQPEGRI